MFENPLLIIYVKAENFNFRLFYVITPQKLNAFLFGH